MGDNKEIDNDATVQLSAEEMQEILTANQAEEEHDGDSDTDGTDDG